MDGRAPELSTEPFQQQISDLIATLKSQRKKVRGNGCLTRQQNNDQLTELDRQLSALKQLQKYRGNFLEFYRVAVFNLPVMSGKELPDNNFNRLMKIIIDHGGQRYAIKLQLTQLAAVHN